MMRRRARPFKFRIRSIYQRDRDNFTIVRMVRIVTAVHAAIGQKCPKNTAMIIHYQVGIFPVTAQLETGATVANKLSVKGGPVTHVEIDGLPVGGEVQMRPHAAAEVEPKLLSTRAAEVAHPGKFEWGTIRLPRGV